MVTIEILGGVLNIWTAEMMLADGLDAVLEPIPESLAPRRSSGHISPAEIE